MDFGSYVVADGEADGGRGFREGDEGGIYHSDIAVSTRDSGSKEAASAGIGKEGRDTRH